jgi:hypothetical protein
MDITWSRSMAEWDEVQAEYEAKKLAYVSEHPFVSAYKQIIQDNMLWINENLRENAVSMRIKEQWPKDSKLNQMCDYFISLNHTENEIICMKDIENATERIKEINRLRG